MRAFTSFRILLPGLNEGSNSIGDLISEKIEKVYCTKQMRLVEDTVVWRSCDALSLADRLDEEFIAKLGPYTIDTLQHY